MLVGGICAAVVLCSIGIYFLFKNKNNEDVFSLLPCKYVDSIGMTDVVKYFKQSDVIDKLKENKNFIAVSLKKNEPDGSFKIVCCVFDKVRSEIVDMQNAFLYHAKRLDEDLQEAFGDKPMLILQ